jgi:hypothetical protein
MTKYWGEEVRRHVRRVGQRRRRALRAGRLARGEYLRSDGYGDHWQMVVVDFSCAWCGVAFRPQRNTARYCSTRCRVAAHRARRGQTN